MGDGVNMKRFTLLLVLVSLMLTIPACSGGLADGNLIGTVVRESDGTLVVRPVIVIGRVLKSPTTPDQIIVGDDQGKFEITIPGGNYNVQIGTSQDGPFYMWPDPVFVEENKTTIALFQLPDGF